MKFYPGYSSKNELVSGRKFGDGYKAFQLARPACVELCKKRSDCKGFHYDNLRTQRLCLISLFSKARFKLKWAKLLTTHCTPKTWSFIFFLNSTKATTIFRFVLWWTRIIWARWKWWKQATDEIIRRILVKPDWIRAHERIACNIFFVQATFAV